MRTPGSLRWQVFGGCFGLTALVVVAFAFALHVQRGAVLHRSLASELESRVAAIGGLCEWEDGVLQFEGGEVPTDPRGQFLRGAAVASWPAAEFVIGDRALFDAVRAQVVPGPTGVFVASTGSLAYARVIEVPARPAAGEEPAQPAFAVLVVTSGSTTAMTANLAGLRANLVWVGCGVLSIAFAIAMWLSHRIVGPVAALATAAARAKAGQRIPMPRGGSCEMDGLATAFDGALARLDDARERQSHFAADASHELRTPIAIVRTQAEVLQLQAHDESRCRQGLEVILGAASRMSAMVDSLLLLARADRDGLAAGMEPCDLASLVRVEIADTKSTAGEPSDFLLVAASDATVLGDAGLLRTLVGNLLRNAIQHGKSAAPICVSVEVTEKIVDLAVVDRGAGIAPAHLPRIFERFFRADDSRSRLTGGAGLGLALVKAIADLHGATCTLHSEPGMGTTVRVVFPLAEVS